MSDSEYEGYTPTKRARLEVGPQISPNSRIRKPKSAHNQIAMMKIDNSVKRRRESFVVRPDDALAEKIKKLEELYDDAFRSEAQENPELSFDQLNHRSLERITSSEEFLKAADLLDLPVLLGLKTNRG